MSPVKKPISWSSPLRGAIRKRGDHDLITQIVSPKLTTIFYPGNQIKETVIAQQICQPEGYAEVHSTPKNIRCSELVIRNSTAKKKYL
jgi:DNA-binding LacI/PurR family transcriptional regulator